MNSTIIGDNVIYISIFFIEVYDVYGTAVRNMDFIIKTTECEVLPFSATNVERNQTA